MKKLLASGIALSALIAGPALAADLPARAPVYKGPPPVYFSWTGCYIGGNIGAARVKRELTDTFTGADWGGTGDGVFMAGGQVGCNYQFNSFVIGAEWDADWLGDRDSDGTGVTIAGNTYKASANSKWTSTLAARFGFAVNSWLFYGKAGFGWVGIGDIAITNVTTGASLVGSSSGTVSGPMFGVGIEYGFSNNWSVKAEFDTIRLPDRSFIATGAVLPALAGDTFTSRRNVQELKIGLNYRFGGASY